MMTLHEVLSLPVVMHGVPEVLAGNGNLDRPIRWVHSGEVPYMAELLKGGELLMMTGIGIGGGEREQRGFVADLAERGIAALAIELGARFTLLPRALVREADRRELPLVALHREIRFVDVTEAVHREIVSRQLDLMRRGDELHRHFTSLMLDGAGIPEVLAELADAIANPVVLEKASQGVLYHATHRGEEASVLAAWDAFARGLPGAPEAIERAVPTGGEERWGRLVALATEGPIDQRASVGVERAVGLIALALLRDQAEQTAASRERGNFLAGLLDREVDEAEARQRAASMRFARGELLLLPIAVCPSPARSLESQLANVDSWRLVWRDVRGELAGRRVPVIAGTQERERELLMVIGIRDEEARPGLADRIATLVADATERHLGVRDGAVICVGPTARNWTSLGAGLRAAVDGLACAAHTESRPWHDVTVPDLEGLLWGLRDRTDVRRFADAHLEPLLQHDRRRHSSLVPTLAALCEHGGRKAETSRALHIERQSLYHRLSRIEEVLRVDLSDGETLLGLHLALRVNSHVER